MRSISLALLIALAGCNDGGMGGTDATGGADTTAPTTAPTTVPTTGASDATTASSDGTTGDATATATATTTTTATATSEAVTTTGTASDTTTTASSGPDDTTDGTGTTGVDIDPVGAVGPKWLRRLDGLNFASHLAALPDGDVAAMITGGLYAKQIVLAQGDADEQVMSSMYVAPALARFDGATGALESARMLAKLGKNAPYGMSARPHQLEVASNGDLLVAGTWVGLVEFFPGSADSATLLAEIKQNADLDRAEEPFYFRMTPAGAVVWLIRGRTPPGLQTTWFNYGKGIAGLPGDEVMIAGDFEASGFVVAHGTPGAKTLNGALDSYFARLGPTGSPVWVHRNADSMPFKTLQSGADGAVYSQVAVDSTIFADTDAPTKTMSEPGLKTGVVGRIAPAGGLEWTANVAGDGVSPLRHFEVALDGTLVLYGQVASALLVRDANGVAMDAELGAPQAWVAGLGPTGEGLWLRALGPTVETYGPALAGDDGVWLVARVAAPYELEVAGQLRSLPALGYPGPATVLLRIGGGGEVDAVQVVGADLWIDSLVWSGPDQASFVMLGGYFCDLAQPFVVNAAGDGLDALPIACDMQPLDDSRGFVAAFPRAL